MTAPRHSDALSNKLAGEDGMWRPSLGYLLLALGLIAAGVAFLLFSPSTPQELDGRDSANPATTAVAATNTPSTDSTSNWPPALPTTKNVTQPVMPEGDADPTRDITSYAMRGETATMPEVIERLHKAGIRGGLGAFSPPGTRPPLIGLAVPEDFVLPEGYVRHHQATDDGQRIEAILMFAPDRQFFDAAKQPIVVPANRVVPPEHAPPGMPIRRIVLPKPVEQAGQ